MAWSTCTADGDPGGGLPPGESVGDILFWNGTEWVANAEGEPNVNAVLVWDGATWIPTDPGLIGAGLPPGTAFGDTLFWNGAQWIVTPDWLAQLDWYIDSGAGDDTNDGTIGAPLATFVEFQKRMRGLILDDDYTVHLTGDQASLPIDFDIGPNGYLDIIFAVTATSAAYTVNAYTAPNPAGTAEMAKIETVAAGTGAGLIDKRVRFTSGPATNCTCWPTEVLNGYNDHTVQCTIPYSFTKANAQWLRAIPVAGNTFVTETLPVVAAMSVHIRRQGGQGFCFAIRNAQFGTQASPIQDPHFDTEGWGSSVGCVWWTNGLQTDGYHVSDNFAKGSVIRGLTAPVDSGRLIGCYFKGIFLLSDVIFWDSILKHGFIGIESGEVHLIGCNGIMLRAADAVQDAILVYNATCRFTVSTNGEPDGYLLIQSQTRYGLNIPPGSIGAYTVAPIILGEAGSNYALIGATIIAVAAGVPYIDPGSNASFVFGMNGDLGS